MFALVNKIKVEIPLPFPIVFGKDSTSVSGLKSLELSLCACQLRIANSSVRFSLELNFYLEAPERQVCSWRLSLLKTLCFANRCAWILQALLVQFKWLVLFGRVARKVTGYLSSFVSHLCFTARRQLNKNILVFLWVFVPDCSASLGTWIRWNRR